MNNTFLRLLPTALGLVSLTTVVRRQLELGHDGDEYTAAIGDLVEDVFDTYTFASNFCRTEEVVEYVQDTFEPLTIRLKSLPEPVRDFSGEYEEETQSDCLRLVDEMIQGSVIVAGARRHGKSTWLRYLAARYFQDNPEANVKIGDPHWSPNPDLTVELDVPQSDWLPSLSKAALKERFVINNPNDIYLQLIAIYEEGCEREKAVREGREFSNGKIAYFVDEYQAVLAEVGDQPALCSMDKIKTKGMHMGFLLKEIMNRFGKFNINLFVNLHSLKGKNTDLDSSVLEQVSIITVGDLIGDNTIKWSGGWGNRQELLEQKQGLGKYAVVAKTPTGRPMVLNTPDWNDYLAEFNFEVPGGRTDLDLWVDDNRKQIENMAFDGLSNSKIADVLNIRRDAGSPQWEALKTITQEIKN